MKWLTSFLKNMAQWCISQGDQDENDFNPDLCEYGHLEFTDLKKAQKHAIAEDLFGEGTVLVMSYQPFYETGFGQVPHWDEVGRWRVLSREEWEFDSYNEEE